MFVNDMIISEMCVFCVLNLFDDRYAL